MNDWQNLLKDVQETCGNRGAILEKDAENMMGVVCEKQGSFNETGNKKETHRTKENIEWSYQMNLCRWKAEQRMGTILRGQILLRDTKDKEIVKSHDHPCPDG